MLSYFPNVTNGSHLDLETLTLFQTQLLLVPRVNKRSPSLDKPHDITDDFEQRGGQKRPLYALENSQIALDSLQI